MRHIIYTYKNLIEDFFFPSNETWFLAQKLGYTPAGAGNKDFKLQL